MGTEQSAIALLLFRVGPVRCCAPADPVQSIIAPPKLTHPPGSSEGKPGIFYHAKHVVSVNDLRHRFGVDEDQQEHPGRMIITLLDGGYTAYWVDEIIEVIDTPREGWSTPPSHLPKGVFSKTLLLKEKIYLFADFADLENLPESGYLARYLDHLAGKPPAEDALEPAGDTPASDTKQARPAPANRPAAKPTGTVPEKPVSLHGTRSGETPTPPATVTPKPSAPPSMVDDRTDEPPADPPPSSRETVTPEEPGMPTPVEAENPPAESSPAAASLTGEAESSPGDPPAPAPEPTGIVGDTHAVDTTADTGPVVALEPAAPKAAQASPESAARETLPPPAVTGPETTPDRPIPESTDPATVAGPEEPQVTEYSIHPADREEDAAPVAEAPHARDRDTEGTGDVTQTRPRQAASDYLKPVPAVVPEEEAPPPRPPFPWRKLAAALVLFITVAAVGIYSFWSTKRPPARTLPTVTDSPSAEAPMQLNEATTLPPPATPPASAPPPPTPSSEPRQSDQDEAYRAEITPDTEGVTIVLHSPAEEPVLKPPQPETTAEPAPQAARPPTKPAANTKPRARREEIVHIVVKGDTLWDIAEHYVKDPYKYPQLARLSKIRDPDRIYPGNRVIIRRYLRPKE